MESWTQVRHAIKVSGFRHQGSLVLGAGGGNQDQANQVATDAGRGHHAALPVVPLFQDKGNQFDSIAKIKQIIEAENTPVA